MSLSHGLFVFCRHYYADNPDFGGLGTLERRSQVFHMTDFDTRGIFWRRLGFNYDYETPAPRYTFTRVVIPLWFPMVLSLGCGILAYRWGRTRCFPAGNCQTCGYDLRAHVPGDKCPECGTLVPSDTKPAPSV